MAARSYRELIAWQKAMDLASLVYQLTGQLPPEERYGLTSQMRRGVVSIASNIAEGQCRASAKDFVRFLRMAYGSLGEVETQIMLAERLGFSSAAAVEALLALCGEVGRLINGLIRAKEAQA